MNNSELGSLYSALTSFITALDELSIKYAIGGSFASSIQGEYRATNDVDVICTLTPENVQRLINGGTF